MLQTPTALEPFDSGDPGPSRLLLNTMAQGRHDLL